MNCPICRHGETQPGAVTVTLERGETTLVFRNVPAQVCENCGEAYVDEPTAAALLNMAEEALRGGVRVEVREFAVA